MNNRQRIQTDNAPAAIGPYSQAIKVGNFVYTAGQVGLDPATGDLVAGGIKEQTRQALNNITAVLDAAGCSPSDVVKTTVFIMDMADFGAMNEVYAGVFGTDDPPARSTVQVAGLPRGARVEIECVAILGGEG
ncbi:MAG TPA: RidA family protein [Chloroflexia bacterium]|nr:RidA family protein [Chloroflexia bacterium]